MIRERRFMVFAFVALLFAAAWLLLGAYARQIEARVVSRPTATGGASSAGNAGAGR